MLCARLRDRQQDRVADEAQDVGDQARDELDRLSDRLGEDALRALPHLPEMREVADAEGSQKLIERAPDAAHHRAQPAELLIEPGADAVDDAVRLQRLEDLVAAWPESHHRVNEVRRVVRDGLLRDRIAADDVAEHVVARNVVHVVADEAERRAHDVADRIDDRAGRRRHDIRGGAGLAANPAGHRELRLHRRAAGDRRGPADDDRRRYPVGFLLETVRSGAAALALNAGAVLLLHDVRDFVRHQREIGRPFAGPEKHIVAQREGPCPGARGQRRSIRSVVHAHAFEIDADALLDGAANRR